jgi:multidrug transporter EmrE-like cation transporter
VAIAGSFTWSVDVGQCLPVPPAALEPNAGHEHHDPCLTMTKEALSMAYLFLILALTLNAAANILLKIGATRLGALEEPGLLGRLVSNHHLWAGLLLFALNVVFYIAALTRLNLSVAYPIMVAGGIVIVVSASTFALQEAITPLQTLGVALLVLGIALVGHRSLA